MVRRKGGRGIACQANQYTASPHFEARFQGKRNDWRKRVNFRGHSTDMCFRGDRTDMSRIVGDGVVKHGSKIACAEWWAMVQYQEHHLGGGGNSQTVRGPNRIFTSRSVKRSLLPGNGCVAAGPPIPRFGIVDGYWKLKPAVASRGLAVPNRIGSAGRNLNLFEKHGV